MHACIGTVPASTTPQNSSDGNKNITLIAGVAGGAAVLLIIIFVVVIVVCCCKKRKYLVDNYNNFCSNGLNYKIATIVIKHKTYELDKPD